MKAVIYHNPRCSKSRATLALLTERGIDLQVVQYLEIPPARKELRSILKQLNKKFGHLGQRVVDDNIRVISRGFDEVQKLDLEDFTDEGHEELLPLGSAQDKKPCL